MKRKYKLNCFSAIRHEETTDRLSEYINENPDYEPLLIGGDSYTMCLLLKHINQLI